MRQIRSKVLVNNNASYIFKIKKGDKKLKSEGKGNCPMSYNTKDKFSGQH